MTTDADGGELLREHPLFEHDQPEPTDETEVTLAQRTLGDPAEAEVRRLVAEGWPEVAAREAVALRQGVRDE